MEMGLGNMKLYADQKNTVFEGMRIGEEEEKEGGS